MTARQRLYGAWNAAVAFFAGLTPAEAGPNLALSVAPRISGMAAVEPIEVAGVDDLADSGLVLNGRIKTRPLEQRSVGRDYNRRIKHAFDDAGVEIPFPHLTVVSPEAKVSERVRR